MAIDPQKLEEKLDRAIVAGTEISMGIGGVKFSTMIELMEFARLMALSGAAVPYHLRNNPGACLAICTRSLRFGFDPFALAEHSFSMKKDVEVTVENQNGGRSIQKVPQETIAYDSYVIRAVIEAHAPIEGRLKYAFSGDGDARKCTVSAKPRGEKDLISLTSPTLGERKAAIGTSEKGNLKGSPLWTSKPDQQLAYDTARDFCRRHFPEILMGWYDKDEFEEHVRAATATDVTPAANKPDVGSRLKGAKGRGFSEEHVNAQTGGAGGATQPAALEHKPGETLPGLKTKEPETVVVERKDGEANTAGQPVQGRHDNTPPAETTAVAAGNAPPPEQAKPEDPKPAQEPAKKAAKGKNGEPKPEPEKPKEETALERGTRILSGLTKPADIADLRKTIAEELGRDEAKAWHLACDSRAQAVGKTA